MRPFKTIGLMLLAMMAVAASASTTAFALPRILTETGGEKETVNASGGTAIELTELGTSLKVSCVSQESEATITGSLGPFHIDFTGCQAQIGGTSIGKCTGLGETTTGVILVTGEAHLVFDALSPPTLGVAVLFLLPAGGVHFECKVITTRLFVVTGQVLCLVSPINTLGTDIIKLKCETTAAGDQADTRYWSDSGVEMTGIHLATAENEGTAVDSAQAGEVLLTTTIPTEIVG